MRGFFRGVGLERIERSVSYISREATVLSRYNFAKGQKDYEDMEPDPQLKPEYGKPKSFF